jgi:hypothetical protein
MSTKKKWRWKIKINTDEMNLFFEVLRVKLEEELTSPLSVDFSDHVNSSTTVTDNALMIRYDGSYLCHVDLTFGLRELWICRYKVFKNSIRTLCVLDLTKEGADPVKFILDEVKKQKEEKEITLAVVKQRLSERENVS